VTGFKLSVLPPAIRCSGHCCRSFPVSASLAHLRAIASDPRRSDREEAAKIADMLVPLGEEVRGGRLQTVYTCKHHDAASGDCTIYDDRPRMCRDYPYRRACEHAECTMRETLVVVDNVTKT